GGEVDRRGDVRSVQLRIGVQNRTGAVGRESARVEPTESVVRGRAASGRGERRVRKGPSGERTERHPTWRVRDRCPSRLVGRPGGRRRGCYGSVSAPQQRSDGGGRQDGPDWS